MTDQSTTPDAVVADAQPASAATEAAARLAPLRDQLEHIGDLDVAERPAVFEAANKALVDAMAALEEV